MDSMQAFTHYRTCNLCEAMCGIAIQVEHNKIVSIKGDPDDPFSKGHICPKALALKDIQEDPDRLKQPLMKTKDGWKTISWNRAFDLVANKAKDIQKTHGKNALGAYFGNPNTHHHGNVLFLLPFIQALKTKNRFSATSNDQLPHMQANLELFGNQYLFPVPDIDHMDLFILLGSNPAASNGSLMSAPDYSVRLKKITQRGEVILIDPRKTETAKTCSEHLFIKPGTDAFLLLGMLNTLFAEGLIETGRLHPHMNGIVEIQLICAEFSPENVSKITGISSENINKLARKLASTPRACLFGRMGTSTQEFGGIATWLIYVINALTNHLDERGGLMFTKPAADMIEIADWLGQKGHINRYKSVSGLPEFSGELPSSTMADQILLESDEQIKMMFVVAGNPILSSSNSQRLDEAFKSLNFMVSIDYYLNETSRHADIILPPTAPLEQSHYDLVFNLISVRNVAKYSPALFENDKKTRHDWQILLELKKRLDSLDILSHAKEAASYQVLKRVGPDGLLDLILRTGPYGTQFPGTSQTGHFLVDSIQGFIPSKHPIKKVLDLSPYGTPNRSLSKGLCLNSLLNYPHGIDLGPLQSRFPERLYTPKKRIRLAPISYLKDMTRLRKAFERQPTDELLLIGRRHVRSNNSWLHNSQRLVKGKNRCTLMIHSEDAKRAKLAEGDTALVQSRVGMLHIETQITDDIMQGVISIPHGWGHSMPDTQLQVASKHPGVNLNTLSDDQFVDKLTGTAAFNGIPVSVSKVKSSELKPGVRVSSELA
ncbi:MAG: anaerobic selenocysteine-containing dehydrogenase [Oleiphilaceae bacterium]|jgi:anaerobic selenocysteine-containing dehydrogenase